MTGVAGRMVRAALEANGVTATSATGAEAAAPSPAKPPRRKRVPSADAVLLLGAPGVLVRTRDGRLPTDREVELDGVCLRVRVGRVYVLVAGSVRRFGVPCRWATASELDPRDLEVVRAAAPSQLAELEQRRRIGEVAREMCQLVGAGNCETRGLDPEGDLCFALDWLHTYVRISKSDKTVGLDFAVAEHMMQA